jgi:hypothetical protein
MGVAHSQSNLRNLRPITQLNFNNECQQEMVRSNVGRESVRCKPRSCLEDFGPFLSSFAT